MLAHGVSTGDLFLLVGMLSDRHHTRTTSAVRRRRAIMPRLTPVPHHRWLRSACRRSTGSSASSDDGRRVPVGSPLCGCRRLSVILSAVYMLWMFSASTSEASRTRRTPRCRSRPREWASVVPLCAMRSSWVFPTLFLSADEAFRATTGSQVQLFNLCESSRQGRVKVKGEKVTSNVSLPDLEL